MKLYGLQQKRLDGHRVRQNIAYLVGYNNALQMLHSYTNLFWVAKQTTGRRALHGFVARRGGPRVGLAVVWPK